MSDAFLIAAHGSRDEAGSRGVLGLGRSLAAAPARPPPGGRASSSSHGRRSARRSTSWSAAGPRRIAVVPAMLDGGRARQERRAERGPGGPAPASRRRLLTWPGPWTSTPHSWSFATSAIARRSPIGRTCPPSGRCCCSSAAGRPTRTPTPTIARVSRFLWEAYGVGWASVGASRAWPRPSVDRALTVCRRTRLRADRRPALLPLRRHPAEADLRDRRAACRGRPGRRDRHDRPSPPPPAAAPGLRGPRHEAVHGPPHMNCDLCKYRVRLIGREADLGRRRRATTTTSAPVGPRRRPRP